MQEKEPQPPMTRRDASWFSFVSVAVAVLLPAYLAGYNVVYTEGEVLQGLYYVLFVIAGISGLSAFYRRNLGIALVAVFGGSLLTWQGYQSRKWAMIQEDITDIVAAAMKKHRETGAFPETMDELKFRHPFVRDHIYRFSSDGAKFSISYFINKPGITYLYSSEDGFSYYPD
jgi:hypothetical protein